MLEVDAVLVATGRVPTSADLNLAAVGVESERGFIPVDDGLRVLAGGNPVPHLWAVGDVTGKLMTQQQKADSLGYVPLPESLRQKALTAVDSLK